MLKISALIAIVIAKTWALTPENTVLLDSTLDFQVVNENLQMAIDEADPGDTLLLKIGRYEAIPRPYRESICGNCGEPLTEVNATVGFHIKGKPLIIIGENRDSTVLATNAGYGILFENSYGSHVGNLTVTHGVRDPDGNATDAAIVVKNSRLIVENVRIADNTQRIDTVVVGIGGIFGREGGYDYDYSCGIWSGNGCFRCVYCERDNN